ncbi:MAG: hypothetical protein L3J20_03970 [Flavobacteriaceae bacterium]|nr:hypothetical protein [Flavobacteriaceae bacterium]
MNITEFTSLLQYPNTVSIEQTTAIEDILDNYPYFQAARIIHLKGLKNQHSYKYNNALKTTAAYTTNRTILFDFITANTLDASNNLEKEQELITDSEIIDLEVVKRPLISSSVLVTNTKPEKVQTAEQKLEIGKPLVFDISEMHSFNEWLQVTSLKPIERKEVKPIKVRKEQDDRFDLIEQFIKDKPKIKPLSSNDNIDIAIESITENESLMTETLARVYLEQKQYNKAIQAFKILSLKYPEKSSFFADRIKAIKFLRKNNS